MTTQDILLKAELGQVWTPPEVALEMAREAMAAYVGIRKVLDPACGPGTFSRALHAAGATGIELNCYDVDERMEKLTSAQNRKLGFPGQTRLQDYLADTTLAGTFDLVITNPPYIRQEAIPTEAKHSYHRYLADVLGEGIDKRANLFALFLLKGVVDLAPGGILCAIVYDAITQSSYGKKTLTLLSRHAELLSCTPAKAPFDGVLVDAQILLYRKRLAVLPKSAENSRQPEPGCVPLMTLLTTRRGTALPVRKGYLAKAGEPHWQLAAPFFIKQQKLEGLLVEADARAYLADSVVGGNPVISDWLRKRADENGIRLKQLAVNPVKGKIAFNYYIRNTPRHLWNKDGVAISDNFYVSSTNDHFPPEVAWLLLNSDEYLDRLVASARNQGNGLKKLQLYEYQQVLLPDWRLLPQRTISSLRQLALTLIENGADYMAVRTSANKNMKGIFHGQT